jgi:excisionase family DNA binding protein
MTSHSKPLPNDLMIIPNIYYTDDEAATLLRIKKQTLLKLLDTGQINGIKIGNEWRILGGALLNLTFQEKDNDYSLIKDWMLASNKTLKELWDNEEDSIYDNL